MNRNAPRRIDFTAATRGLAQRQAERISAGDAAATARAIRCARNRGDWQTAERLTAGFYAARPDLMGAAQRAGSAARDGAAVLATIPLSERFSGVEQGS